ncbi:hypothetical protein AB685_04095 [Bacillus sp. LL01]|nr:hypothetical protein AB685_04095 [Bacillus sp. LL01]
MANNMYEKQHIKSMATFSYLTLASMFSFVFTFICILILLFPMIGILDFTYFPSKVGIPSFVISMFFSVLAFKNIFGKILIVFNLCLMIFMIVYGP